jgi:hypothetical protein
VDHREKKTERDAAVVLAMDFSLRLTVYGPFCWKN